MKTLAIVCNDQVYHWQLTGPDHKKHEVVHHPILIADDWTMIKEAALGGLGIALLPERISREEVKAKKLEQILPDYTLPQAKLYVMYSSRRGQISAVRCFIDFLVERIDV